MKYLACDVESGGVDSKKQSILTAYLAVLDSNFNIIDELELAVKPNDGNYVVTAEAMNINKINLIEHDAKAITESEAGGKLRDFLIQNNKDGADKLIPVGHNVKFDIIFMGDKLLNIRTIEKYVSYRYLDTGVLAQALKAIGKIPESVSGSLGSLVSHYKINPGEFHTARGDTLMTIEVLKRMLAEIK